MTSKAAFEANYSFLADWFDPAAELTRQFQVTFHCSDNAVSIFDLKSKKQFLKRTPYPSVAPEQFFVGSVVTVFGRQLRLTDFADSFTREKLAQQKTRTLALIKPDAYLHIGAILQRAIDAGLTVAQLRWRSPRAVWPSSSTDRASRRTRCQRCQAPMRRTRTVSTTPRRTPFRPAIHRPRRRCTRTQASQATRHTSRRRSEPRQLPIGSMRTRAVLSRAHPKASKKVRCHRWAFE